MELLKKGIIIGLGAHDMSKKQIEDFTKKLHESRLVSKDQAKDLVETILKRNNKLYEEFMSLSKRKKRQLMFYYVRKYNEATPLYLAKPEY